jgi:hypothetical protein
MTRRCYFRTLISIHLAAWSVFISRVSHITTPHQCSTARQSLGKSLLSCQENIISPYAHSIRRPRRSIIALLHLQGSFRESPHHEIRTPRGCGVMATPQLY